MPHASRFEDMVIRNIAAELIMFRSTLHVFKRSIATGPNGFY